MGGCSRCFVPNCHKTGSDDRKTHLPFRNVQLLYKWLNAIKNPISLDRNLEYFRRIRVCTKHFEEQHVIPRFYPSCNNKAVKPYAVPSLYLPRVDEKWDVCFVENDEGELVIRNVAEPEKDSVYILNDTQPAVIHNYAVNVPVVARHEILSTMCHICTESRSVLRNVDDVVEDVTYRELLKASFPDINGDVFDVVDLICETCCGSLFSVWKFRKLCLGNVEKLKRFRGVTDVGVEIERIPEKSPEPDIAAGVSLTGPPAAPKLLSQSQNPPPDKSRTFTCNLCKITCPNIASLWRHKTSKHSVRNIICGLCHKKFATLSLLKRHLFTHTKPFHCTQCPRRFRSKDLLKTHELKHVEATLRCERCEKKFRTNKALLLHRGEGCEKRERTYMCEVCGKVYRAKLALDEHLRTHTGAKPFSCPNCGKEFRTRMQLIVHKEVHSEVRSYVCEECGKAFKTKRTFQMHRKIHTGKKPFACAYCDRKFLYKKGYDIHTRTHTNERPYKCTYENCTNDYNEKNQLKKHIMCEHVKEKNFKCNLPDCGREFYFASNLRWHIKRHDRNKKFPCEKCDRAFKTKAVLLNHMRQVHRTLFRCACGEAFNQRAHLTVHRQDCEVYQTRHCKSCEANFEDRAALAAHRCSSVATLTCLTCNRAFKNIYNLRQHLLIHTQEKPFQCDVCDKKFRQKMGLKVHKYIHTGERLYACNMCDKKYRQPTHLYEHVNMHLGIKPHKCELCTKAYRQKRDLTLHLDKVHGVKPAKDGVQVEFEEENDDANVQ